MKKFLGIAISTLMVGSLLIGCGESDTVTTTEAAIETTTEAAAPSGIDVEPMSEEVSMGISVESASDVAPIEGASDAAALTESASDAAETESLIGTDSTEKSTN